MKKQNNNGFKIVLLILIIILIGIFGYLAYNKYVEYKDKANNTVVENTDLMDTLSISEKADLFDVINNVRFMGLMEFNNGTDDNIQDIDFASLNDSQIAFYILLTQDFSASQTICFTTSYEPIKNCIIDDTSEYSSAEGYNEAFSINRVNEYSKIIFGKEIDASKLNGYTLSYLYDGEYYVLDSNGGTSDPYEIKDVSLSKSGDKYIATIKAEGHEDYTLPETTYKFSFKASNGDIYNNNIIPISFVQEK